jgi:hypothetical protein
MIAMQNDETAILMLSDADESAVFHEFNDHWFLAILYIQFILEHKSGAIHKVVQYSFDCDWHVAFSSIDACTQRIKRCSSAEMSTILLLIFGDNADNTKGIADYLTYDETEKEEDDDHDKCKSANMPLSSWHVREHAITSLIRVWKYGSTFLQESICDLLLNCFLAEDHVFVRVVLEHHRPKLRDAFAKLWAHKQAEYERMINEQCSVLLVATAISSDMVDHLHNLCNRLRHFLIDLNLPFAWLDEKIIMLARHSSNTGGLHLPHYKKTSPRRRSSSSDNTTTITTEKKISTWPQRRYFSPLNTTHPLFS